MFRRIHVELVLFRRRPRGRLRARYNLWSALFIETRRNVLLYNEGRARLAVIDTKYHYIIIRFKTLITIMIISVQYVALRPCKRSAPRHRYIASIPVRCSRPARLKKPASVPSSPTPKSAAESDETSRPCSAPRAECML